jgi:two-component system cell cycle response regulator
MPHVTVGSDNQLETATAIIRSLQEELVMAKKQIELLWEKNRELERLSITDELTGLYNQRHFSYRLEQEVAKNRRQRHPLCLLFFDVDGLKTYNDTYGHLGGDDVLRAVARSLSGNIEENSDSGYRYGGDEFAVILTEARPERAVEVARRINEHLRKAGFHHVTLSFGVAELGPGMDSKALFRHADDAMYMAKRGRGIRFNTHRDKIYVYQ